MARFRLPGALRRRLDGWIARRMGEPRAQTRLDHRRIYILPTGAAAALVLLLAGLLLLAINYRNALVYLLAFWLAAAAVVAILHTFRNLAGLRLRPGPVAPVFAGDTARFRVTLENPDARPRLAVTVGEGAAETGAVDVPARGSAERVLAVPAPERGWLDPGPFRVTTRFPAGLFRAWSWVRLDWGVAVYPRPEAGPVPAPPAETGSGSGSGAGPGQEDFAGLRRYRAGDPLRHVVWRLVARGGEPLTKELAGGAGERLWLDYQVLEGLGPEARLSRLCRWVLDAERAGLAYGLALPGTAIPPARGERHRHRCLAALAAYRP